MYELVSSSSVTASDEPLRNKQGTSLLSASRATHVQVSPHPSAFLSAVVFFALEPAKLQISSHWIRLRERLTKTIDWWAEQAAPRSTRSFWIVVRCVGHPHNRVEAVSFLKSGNDPDAFGGGQLVPTNENRVYA